MKPIINSLLDNDYYSFTQANLIYKKHKDVHVKYAFKNRTESIILSNWINVRDLEEQIGYVQELKFTDDELKWLWEKAPFSLDFIQELSNIKLPNPKIITKNDQFVGIEVEGDWFSSLFWEIPLLSIINQLFNKKYIESASVLFDDEMMLKGIARIDNKIQTLKQYPEITIVEFGSRRRFSRKWQEYIVQRLSQDIPNQLVGTSNVMYAKQNNIKLSGTMSHQLFMCYAILYNEDLVLAQNTLLDDWWAEYGGPLSIALIDTWGTDFFFNNISTNHLINWWGTRQDSGDPFVIGDKVVDFYKLRGIDPVGKMLLFSDGLDIDKVVKLHNYFNGKINTGFGIGTNLTNDLGGQPLSIVIKLSEVNGQKTCKLSDNASKSIADTETIEKYKKLVNYDSDFTEQPVY